MRIAEDSVELSTITSRVTDAEVPWACRNVRAGLVTARRDSALMLGTLQFGTAGTLTTLGIVVALATVIMEWSDAPVVAY